MYRIPKQTYTPKAGTRRIWPGQEHDTWECHEYDGTDWVVVPSPDGEPMSLTEASELRDSHGD